MSDMLLKNAVGDKVLVRQIRPEEITPGGIHIPATANRAENIYAHHGTVVAKGPDAPHGFDVGDHVICDRHTPTVLWRGDELRVVPGDGVWAVVEARGSNSPARDEGP